MAITKHSFQFGTQARLGMFGPSRHWLPADDAEWFVDEVDCSALAIGAELTFKQQPVMAQSLAFTAPIAKDFTATFDVHGIDGFGEREFVERVVLTGDPTGTGLVGDPWPCVQTANPVLWVERIVLVAYEEASATGAGTVAVGSIQKTNIGAVYYDHPGILIQVPRGRTNLQTYITSVQLDNGILNTEPRENVVIDPETGFARLPQLLAGTARELSITSRPDLRP